MTTRQDLIDAINTVTDAISRVRGDYDNERRQAMLNIEKKYFARLRTLQSARRAIREQLDSEPVLLGEFFDELKEKEGLRK